MYKRIWRTTKGSLKISSTLNYQIIYINRYLVEKRPGMNTTQIRQKIHDYVDQADHRLLTLINGMIEADKDQD